MDPQNAKQIAAVLLHSPAAAARRMGDGSSAEDAEAVIEQLLHLSTEGTPEGKINEAMTKLEKLADSYPGLTLLLMAALEPKASDLYLHDVSDSIGIWEWEIDRRFTIALRGMPAFCAKAEVEADPEEAEGKKESEDTEQGIIGLLDTLCRELKDTHRPVLEIQGCGLEWCVDVWMELSIMLEQLPEVLQALREGRRTCLHFFEQGFQRIVWLEPEGRVVRCLDPNTEEELGRGHLALGELLESFRKLLVDFVSYAWMAFPEEASHPAFVEWQNACLPEAG